MENDIYLKNLAEVINKNASLESFEKEVFLDGLQNIFLYVTKNKNYCLKVEYKNFIIRGKTKKFGKANYVKEHVLGRRKTARLALESASKLPFTQDSLYNFLLKYCFYIKVPKESGITGSTLNGMLRIFQNKENLIKFEDYIKVMEECGWKLTEKSLIDLKNKMYLI